MWRPIVLCTAAVLALMAVPAYAADKQQPPDERVASALKAADLRFNLEDSGEYSVLIEWSNDGDRTHVARIPSATFRWQQTEWRDVYAVAYKIKGDGLVEAKLANRLLVENNDSLLGFWARQGDTLLYIARIPATATPSVLREAVMHVGEMADDLEKEVTRADDY